MNITMAQTVELNAISCGGGCLHSGNINISWTIGEPVSEYIESNNISLTQGFHQTNFNILSIKNYTENSIHIKTYPNPTNKFLYIEQADSNQKNHFKIMDMTGKILITQTSKQQITEIDLSAFQPGVYFVNIMSDDKSKIKTYKIQKN